MEQDLKRNHIVRLTDLFQFYGRDRKDQGRSAQKRFYEKLQEDEQFLEI